MVRLYPTLAFVSHTNHANTRCYDFKIYEVSRFPTNVPSVAALIDHQEHFLASD